jgi:hypothetical protein
MRKARVLSCLVLGAVVMFCGGWALTYPSPDPVSARCGSLSPKKLKQLIRFLEYLR